MKLLFLCNLVPAKCGAFEAMLATLGHESKKAGNEFVAVFAGEPIPPVADSLHAAGVRWHTLPEWVEKDHRPQTTDHRPQTEEKKSTVAGEKVHPWRFVFPALRLLRKERPDVAVVHFGNEVPTFILILLARLIGLGRVKWVWHQHQQINPPVTFAQRRASRIRLLSLVCDRFVALYEGGGKQLLARGIPDRKIIVVPNGTTEPRRSRAAGWLREALGLPSDASIVVNVSSLIIRKRVDVTIDAFATLCQTARGTCQLVLVGAGPEERALDRLAAERGVKDRVSFMGQRDDVSDILAESDVVCLSSSAEACPYVLLEAMALGRPCVATDAGAAAEIVDEGSTGYVVPCGDAEALAEKLRVLLGDPVLRNQYGQMGRRKWEACFTLERQVRTLTECYEFRKVNRL